MGRAILLLALLAAGCRTRPPDWQPWQTAFGGSFSAIPHVGVAAEGGAVIHRTERFDYVAEGEVTYQFLDDADLASDGSPGKLDAWWQLRAGIKQIFSPGHKRHLVVRYGAVFFHATGTPGLVDAAGSYFGIYGGIGFETDLNERWTAGPELRVLIVDGDASGVEIVPQFAWHLVRRF